MSVFYDHLLGLDNLHNEMMNLDLPAKQHYHLLGIADSTLHNEILNLILLEIPVETHEHFVVEFDNRPQDPNHLTFLKQYSGDIEDKIAARAKEVRAKFINELQQVK